MSMQKNIIETSCLTLSEVETLNQPQFHSITF